MNDSNNPMRINRLDTPVPRRLAYRPRDHRGYPVPYIVVEGRQADGSRKYEFVVNDSSRVAECLRYFKCGLCGRTLEGAGTKAMEAWFVGGPRCFLHPMGAFLDPPMHRECAEYALKVCPYIAAPNYNGDLGAVLLERQNERLESGEALAEGRGLPTLPPGMAIAEHPVGPQSNPDRPPIFAFGMANGYDVKPSGPSVVIVPRVALPDGSRYWRELSFWRHGRMLRQDEFRFTDDHTNVELVT